MRCSNCGAENPEGNRFCGDCGATMARRCARCGADNPAGKRFCGDCGAALGASDGSAKPPAPSPPIAKIPTCAGPDRAAASADGERRHLTVLFSDLVGSTEIAAHLDAEDWREIAAQYQRTAAAAVTRFGGHVAKYLGDGLMVYFGWPQAHEDDAERAVRAGLAIVDEVAALNGRLASEHRVKLAVRVGIQTGSVVMGQGGGEGADVFGDAPNVASRVQSAAQPDSVVITAAVQELVAGRFVVEDRGAQQLKGIEHPLQLYRVAQPSEVRRRTRRAAARGLTPFVGREDDLDLLLSRWERAREGHGQLVLVMGEPGIGKSRLVEEFRAQLRDEAHLWIEGAGEQFSHNTPFHAVTEILEQGLGWRGDESPAERVVQLERRLEEARLKLGEAVPLIAELLNLPSPDRYPPLMFAPDQRRKRLLANLSAWVLNLARVQPAVMAMEDLHWVDPSTLELVQTLVEQAATAPLMLLCTTRPEFPAPWPMRAHHAQITLNRLNNRHTREMIAGVVARSALAPDLIDAVVQRTDGVPLFAEELTRLILEGDGRSVVHDIPATLHDSLTARLDRLGAAKEIAQVAAVIGREFSYGLLGAVAPAGNQDLQSALEKLVDAELIYARGVPPDATYQFRHALMRDAAYEGLLKTRRRELHHRVAQTITENFAAMAEDHPEIIARHWTEAGDAQPAIAAWKKAATAAVERHAFREGEESYQQALAVLHTQPQSPERDANELDLANALYRVLLVTRGYTAPESVEAAAKARTLAEKAGNLAQLIQQVYATWAAVHNSGDHLGAAALADHLLDLAQREGNPANLGFAHMAQLETCYYLGNLVGTEEHFERLNSFLEAPGFKQFPGIFVIVMGFAGINAWTLGHSVSAFQPIARAIAFGRTSQNPYDLALARFFESWLRQFLGEPELVEAISAESLAISEQHGLSYTRDLAHIMTGWARAKRGSTREGIAQIREGLAGIGRIGARLGLTTLLTLLAEAQALDGAIAEAVSTVQDALQVNPQEIVFRPQILRLRGELLLKLNQPEPAETDFREAIAQAQKMRARAWELRAALSLARMLRARGGMVEARRMLAPLYSGFTEGFDTPDLKEARALLAELNGAVPRHS
jgi:class 3 adenylate cyclase/tetratricopeptide (TPR) repeat protein